MIDDASAEQRRILDKIYKTLLERKKADPETSYVASLYQRGTKHIASKVIEEAGEAAIEGVAGDKERLKAESADLLFHLMILWADQGITPQEVLDVLKGRTGKGGHADKKSRAHS
jgi:phosphoribosyl-ATP pyrophosphohydrolase